MEAQRIVCEITSLPPDVQEQVADFVAFLKTRHLVTHGARKAKRTRLADEPFIGMWEGREDMQNSAAWVRCLRRREWEQRP